MSEIPTSRSGKPALDVARGVMLEAGEVLLTRFHGEKSVREKGRADIVTDVDYEVEALILGRLGEEFPGFGVLAEESGAGGEQNAEFTWIVDPLDGTRNYAIGVPYFSTTCALARGDEVLLGVTYDPCRQELFWAEAGRGAFLNGQRFQCGRHTSFDAATIATDLGYDDDQAGFALKLLDRLWPGMQGIRIMGSAALGLAYAASGRIDVYFHHFLAPWDIAAGIVLAREAGALITDRKGNPVTVRSPSVIAANPRMHAEFLRVTEGLEWREAE